MGGYSQGVAVDEETPELGRGDLGQVERQGGLQHAHAHAGEELGDEPVLPVGGKGLYKDALERG